MQSEMQSVTVKIDEFNSNFPFRSIARIHAADITPQSFFEDYQKEGIPVIVTGLLEGEPDWDLGYLSEKLGHLEFPVRHYGRDRYQQDKRTWKTTGSGVEVKTLRFLDYASLLESSEALAQDIYLARCALTHTPLANHAALTQAETHLGLKFPVSALNLWVGPSGHTSCLHYDPMDGSLIQMYGAKRVVLFPPSQLYNLYPFSVWNHLCYGLKRRAVYSQVYPDRPDFEVFPNVKHALEHRYEVVLNQGELLFIPSGWWHEITSLGNGVVCSINRWWQVYPLARAVRLWGKWRVHWGSVLAFPHIAWDILKAVSSTNQLAEVSKLVQRL